MENSKISSENRDENKKEYMFEKDRIIGEYGLGDGNDEVRYRKALNHHKSLDMTVLECFRSIIGMEKKGLLSIVDQNKKELGFWRKVGNFITRHCSCGYYL